jgi:hypothetical protein
MDYDRIFALQEQRFVPFPSPPHNAIYLPFIFLSRHLKTHNMKGAATSVYEAFGSFGQPVGSEIKGEWGDFCGLALDHVPTNRHSIFHQLPPLPLPRRSENQIGPRMVEEVTKSPVIPLRTPQHGSRIEPDD